MKLLEKYFIGGLSVSKIAETEELSEDEVRDRLRSVGINISDGSDYDTITTTIKALGYRSFVLYMHDKGFSPIKAQARQLGVDRNALTRLYDAWRNFSTAQHAPREDAGGDQGEDSEAQGDN